ncbi:MAG: hypothetical protein M3R02_20365 [Chloroflexota bacterium]|nr:hypothetical protein [Chloroflexota bacterium]
MDEPGGRAGAVTAEQVRILAAAAGVELSDERARTLVPQAEPHLALMRAVDAIDHRGVEPAGEFRLDEVRRSTDG